MRTRHGPGSGAGPGGTDHTNAPPSGRLRFSPARTDRHGRLLDGWLRRPHVLPWWTAEAALGGVAHLDAQLARDHLTPWVVSLDAVPFAYVETYRAAEDPLAAAFPLRAGDRGWHVLVGPAELLGTGVPRQLGRAVLARLLAEPGVDRVVCEPDERNLRMVRYCEALGYERLATVDLPDKRAALMAWRRPPPADPSAPVPPAGTGTGRP